MIEDSLFDDVVSIMVSEKLFTQDDYVLRRDACDSFRACTQAGRSAPPGWMLVFDYAWLWESDSLRIGIELDRNTHKWRRRVIKNGEYKVEEKQWSHALHAMWDCASLIASVTPGEKT